MCSSKPKAINVSNEQLPAVPSVAANDPDADDLGEEEDDASLLIMLYVHTLGMFRCGSF